MKTAGRLRLILLAAALSREGAADGARAQQLGYGPSDVPVFQQYQANASAPAAPSAAAPSDADLAKQLANPIANLISVPLQSNLDFGGGASRAGTQYILNIQPVIPFKLNDDWNLIVRTIVPVTDVWNILPYNAFGIGEAVPLRQGHEGRPRAPLVGANLVARRSTTFETAALPVKTRAA